MTSAYSRWIFALAATWILIDEATAKVESVSLKLTGVTVNVTDEKLAPAIKIRLFDSAGSPLRVDSPTITSSGFANVTLSRANGSFGFRAVSVPRDGKIVMEVDGSPAETAYRFTLLAKPGQSIHLTIPVHSEMRESDRFTNSDFYSMRRDLGKRMAELRIASDIGEFFLELEALGAFCQRTVQAVLSEEKMNEVLAGMPEKLRQLNFRCKRG